MQRLFQASANGTSSAPPSSTNSTVDPNFSSSPATSPAQRSLGTGSIAGIVIGCAVGLLAAVICLWLLLQCRKNSQGGLLAGNSIHTQSLNEPREDDVAKMRQIGELPVIEPTHELNTDRSAWELPVVTRPAEKATWRYVLEMYG